MPGGWFLLFTRAFARGAMAVNGKRPRILLSAPEDAVISCGSADKWYVPALASGVARESRAHDPSALYL
jgi:hypothetical protein